MIKLIDFEYCNFIKYSEEVNRFNKEIENGKISYGSICQFEINKRYVNFSHIIKRIIGFDVYIDYNSEDFFEMIKINKRNEKIEKIIN